MPPFGRIPKNAALRRSLAVGVIVLAAWSLSLLPQATALTRPILHRADYFFYDTYYRLRPIESRADGPVVIVALDQRSLDAVDKTLHYGDRWPRELWAHILTYLGSSGAKAVAFDLLLSETSVYDTRLGDDRAFADMVADVKMPVVFASMVSDGAWGRFAPPLPSPIFGAVNVGAGRIFRSYVPTVEGRDSLAVAAVKAASPPPRLPTDRPFLLHYYGPHQAPDGRRTFSYISAASVLAAQLEGDAAAKAAGVTPDLFRGKIVLIGAIAAGEYDLKASPLADAYPGVEVHATAIENLLAGQEVLTASFLWQWLAALAGAAAATCGIILPRRAILKSLGPIAAIAGIVGAGILLFRGGRIVWLPPVSPLLAIALATLGAFTWTYYLEDRQRRFMLKALSKVVSPEVAAQLSRDPERLALGTVRTELSVLFTDLANFTDLSESMEGDQLTRMLNFYLGQMSDQVLAHDGTLDKYIGDAIMCFWNAPLPQADHAARACRAALAIVRREREIQPELRTYTPGRIFTRIGVNTTSVAVGFIGSDHLFNYTALGDGVNLASRLEGANKLYGTRILLSETTAHLVADQFLLRKIDVLRVKGKHQPIAVFELLAEKGKEPQLEPLVQIYEQALGRYQAQQWDEAQRLLLELCERFPDDAAARALLKRIAHLRLDPPPADWDGVYDAKEK